LAITIEATAGSGSANSFVTEAEVISYMAARLNASTWTSVTGSTCTESEKKALVEATRDLSVREWLGARVDSTQSLSWPRNWAVDPDSPINFYFDADVVPQRVKDATCELAFQYLNAGTTDIAALDANIGVKVKTIDVLTTEYFEPHQRAQGLSRFPRVMAYIKPLLAGSGITTPVIRG
jgi:hypothetical protein